MASIEVPSGEERRLESAYALPTPPILPAAWVHWLVDLARYGSLLTVFLSYLFQPAAAHAKAEALLLLSLAVLASLQDSYGPRRFWLWLLLAHLEIAAVVLLGLLDQGVGWSWLLYYMLAMHAAYTLPPRPALYLVALLFLARLGTLLFGPAGPSPADVGPTILASLWLFSLVSVGGRLVRDQITEKERLSELARLLERSHRQLETAYQELQESAKRLEEATALRERTRVAREIHDGLGHTMTVLQFQLEAACRLAEVGDPRLQLYLYRCRDLIHSATVDVRRAIQALRPPPIAPGTLCGTLLHVAREFEAATGLRTITRFPETEPEVHTDVAQTLYRCLQEALTNAGRHSGAKTVVVHLRAAGRHLLLRIRDDGHGQATLSKGFGLTSIEERLIGVGGTVRCRTAPGRGFSLLLVAPREPSLH